MLRKPIVLKTLIAANVLLLLYFVGCLIFGLYFSYKGGLKFEFSDGDSHRFDLSPPLSLVIFLIISSIILIYILIRLIRRIKNLPHINSKPFN